MPEQRRKYICLDCDVIRLTTSEAGCRECRTRNLIMADEEAIEVWERRRMDQQYMWKWHLIKDCRKDRQLQDKHSVEKAKMQYAKWVKPCPKCNTPPDKLTWIYFSTPGWTWFKRMGRAGWVVVCDNCKHQLHFFLEWLN